MLTPLRESDALRCGELVRRSKLRLTLGELSSAPLELGLLLGELRLPLADVQRPAGELAVVSACRQRLTKPRRERIHLLGGNFHAEDEALVGRLLRHKRLP